MSALLTRSGFNRQKTAKARAKGAESEGQAKRRSAPSHPPASQCLLEWLPPPPPVSPTPGRLWASSSSTLTPSQWPERGPCDITSPSDPVSWSNASDPQRATSAADSAHHVDAEVVLVFAAVCVLRLCLYVFFPERPGQRAPGQGALRRALPDQAQPARARPGLAGEQVALALFCRLAVRDTEVSR